jgi:hypothetical protein
MVMLRRLISKVIETFRPQWVYLYPDIAKLEREINAFAKRLRLPKFKVEEVSERDGAAKIVILVHNLFWGYRRAFSLPLALLGLRLALRLFLWGNYLDLAFRFVLSPKAMWVLVRPSSDSIITEIYPEDYLNYIYLALERVWGKWQIEIQKRTEEDWELEKLPSEPVRVYYDNWNAAIEAYLNLLWSLSMPEPAQVWATVKQLSGLSQL